jgi:hypothetical protein
MPDEPARTQAALENSPLPASFCPAAPIGGFIGHFLSFFFEQKSVKVAPGQKYRITESGLLNLPGIIGRIKNGLFWRR